MIINLFSFVLTMSLVLDNHKARERSAYKGTRKSRPCRRTKSGRDFSNIFPSPRYLDLLHIMFFVLFCFTPSPYHTDNIDSGWLHFAVVIFCFVACNQVSVFFCALCV